MKIRAFFLMLGLAAAAVAAPVEIKLPPESVQLTASPLPGYALTQALCLTCHSAEYMQYQPPSSARAYWQATLTKMQKTFAAPIPDDAVAPIVDYLVKTYGAERSPVGAGTVGGRSPAATPAGTEVKKAAGK